MKQAFKQYLEIKMVDSKKQKAEPPWTSRQPGYPKRTQKQLDPWHSVPRSPRVWLFL